MKKLLLACLAAGAVLTGCASASDSVSTQGLAPQVAQPTSSAPRTEPTQTTSAPVPTPSPVVTTSVAPPPAVAAAPVPAPAKKTTAAKAPSTKAATPKPPAPPAAVSCHPLTNGGNCYSAGQFCRTSDHGVSGIAANGARITCIDKNGWRWVAS